MVAYPAHRGARLPRVGTLPLFAACTVPMVTQADTSFTVHVGEVYAVEGQLRLRAGEAPAGPAIFYALVQELIRIQGGIKCCGPGDDWWARVRWLEEDRSGYHRLRAPTRTAMIPVTSILHEVHAMHQHTTPLTLRCRVCSSAGQLRITDIQDARWKINEFYIPSHYNQDLLIQTRTCL
jgi:hypothetical protein